MRWDFNLTALEGEGVCVCVYVWVVVVGGMDSYTMNVKEKRMAMTLLLIHLLQGK